MRLNIKGEVEVQNVYEEMSHEKDYQIDYGVFVCMCGGLQEKEKEGRLLLYDKVEFRVHGPTKITKQAHEIL